MLKQIKISTRGKILFGLIFIVFLLNIGYIFNSLSQLSYKNANTNRFLETQSIFKSIMVAGLLFNSSKGVVFFNPTGALAKKTMKKAEKDLVFSMEQLKKQDPNVYGEIEGKYQSLIKIVKMLNAKVATQSISKMENAESLKLWRDLKFTMEPIGARLNKDGKKAQAEYQNYQNGVKISITIFSGVASLALILLVFFMINSISSSIKETRILTYELSQGDGDLTKRLNIKGKDEIKEISVYINIFIKKIQEIVKSSKNLSAYNAKSSEDLSVTIESIKNRLNLENQNVAKLNKESDSTKEKLYIAENLQNETSDKTQKIAHNLMRIEKDFGALRLEVQKNTKSEIDASKHLEDLTERAKSVKGVLDMIENIAEQTNLLALNAAIEAARAGEHGRGFAVVADEVRQLSETTQQSLTQINSIVNLVVEGIEISSKEIQTNSTRLQDLINETIKMEELIQNLRIDVEDISQKSVENTELFLNISKSTELIIDGVKDISYINSQNTQSIVEINKISQDLASSSLSLNEQLNEFRD